MALGQQKSVKEGFSNFNEQIKRADSQIYLTAKEKEPRGRMKDTKMERVKKRFSFEL